MKHSLLILTFLGCSVGDWGIWQARAGASTVETLIGTDPVECCSEAKALLANVSHLNHATGTLRLRTGQKQLFLDNQVLAQLTNVERHLHQPIKQGAVIRPERSWEGGSIQIRTGPSWIPEKKTWMLWYAGNSGSYATSTDGIHWQKPLRREDAVKSPASITPYTVFYDADDPASGGCYKGLAEEKVMPVRGGGFYPAISSDARIWKVLRTSFIPSSDEWHLFHDESRHLYVATVKLMGPYLRSVYLSVSKDFEHWTDPRDCLIFHADRRDQELGAKLVQMHANSKNLLKPVLNRPEEYQTDIYNMPVFSYEGLYIGSSGI